MVCFKKWRPQATKLDRNTEVIIKKLFNTVVPGAQALATDYGERGIETIRENIEWFDIKQNLKNLKEVVVEEVGKKNALSTEAMGSCYSIFKAVGIFHGLHQRS